MKNKPIYYADIEYVRPKVGYELANVTVYNLKEYDERYGTIPCKMIKEANKDPFVFYFYEENKDDFLNVDKIFGDYVPNKEITLKMAIESYQELIEDYGCNPEDIDRDKLQEYIVKAKVKQKIKS